MQEPRMDEGKIHEGDWENHVTAGLKGMRSDVMDKMKDFPSKEFRDHARAAQREMLLAFRSLIDLAIDKLEEKDKPDEPKSGRVTIE